MEINQNTKELTPKEYACLYKCSPTYIRKMLIDDKLDKLPNVIEIKRYSRFYLLIVPADLSKINFHRNSK